MSTSKEIIEQLKDKKRDYKESVLLKSAAASEIQDLVTNSLQLAATKKLGAPEFKFVKEHLDHFNTSIQALWLLYVDAQQELLKTRSEETDQCIRNFKKFKATQSATLDKNKDEKEALEAQLAESLKLNEEYAARLEEGTGIAEEVRTKLVANLPDLKPPERTENDFDINDPITEDIASNNKKPSLQKTRWDLTEAETSAETYVGRDGRVYNADGTLLRNGGTRRRRQRRGRKSRR